jgi:hypothetical protein
MELSGMVGNLAVLTQGDSIAIDGFVCSAFIYFSSKLFLQDVGNNRHHSVFSGVTFAALPSPPLRRFRP